MRSSGALVISFLVLNAGRVLAWQVAADVPARYAGGVEAGAPYLECTVARPGDHGALAQTADAAPFRGKRVRLAAKVRVQGVSGWAGAYLRVDGPGGRVLALDNMRDRPLRGTQDGVPCALVLDVPATAVALSYGLVLAGTGRAWIADAALAEAPAGAEPTGRAVKDGDAPETAPAAPPAGFAAAEGCTWKVRPVRITSPAWTEAHVSAFVDREKDGALVVTLASLDVDPEPPALRPVALTAAGERFLPALTVGGGAHGRYRLEAAELGGKELAYVGVEELGAQALEARRRAHPPTLTLDLKDARVPLALRLVARQGGVNVILAPGVDGEVTIDVKDMEAMVLFREIVRGAGLTCVKLPFESPVETYLVLPLGVEPPDVPRLPAVATQVISESYTDQPLDEQVASIAKLGSFDVKLSGVGSRKTSLQLEKVSALMLLHGLALTEGLEVRASRDATGRAAYTLTPRR